MEVRELLLELVEAGEAAADGAPVSPRGLSACSILALAA